MENPFSNEIMSIAWDSKFLLGIQRIDLEHKIFLELINNFGNSLAKKQDKLVTNRSILEIEKYAEFHFVSEENFMIQINYPEYEKHKLEHFELLEKFNIAKHNDESYREFFQFIKEWFVYHTVKEDQNIASFYRKQKNSPDFS